MNAKETVELIDKVARELQSRFTFNDIDHFFNMHNVQLPDRAGESSKWVYAKTALRGVRALKLIQIADELGFRSPQAEALGPPKVWVGTNHFRLFLSHIAKRKTIAIRLKECLSDYAISAFVAHEDIHPTSEWQIEVERALRTMDALVAIHTVGFSESNWTQQEVGFAIGRGVKVISFKMGEDPTGFISNRQALLRNNRKAEEISKEIESLLQANSDTASRLGEARSNLRFVGDPDVEIPF